MHIKIKLIAKMLTALILLFCLPGPANSKEVEVKPSIIITDSAVKEGIRTSNLKMLLSVMSLTLNHERAN